MCEHLLEFLVSQSLSIILILSPCTSHLFLPPSPSMLLLSRAAWRPRVWFAVVGPAIPPLPYFLKMLPFLTSCRDSRAKRQRILSWSEENPLGLLAASVLACPHLLANLVDGAQVRVVN